MNTNNLHELINRYEERLEYFYVENDELFKWRAVKRFQQVWNSDEYKNVSFAEKFNAAKSEFLILTDNKMISPSNGVVKIAEKKEDEVRHLFEDVLFADDGGDLDIRQNHMEEFMDGMEKLRQDVFPNSWKFKQDDRHAASCYLSALRPDENYIYKYEPTEKFAQYVEFGFDIGSGSNFRLKYYYDLCDTLVAALREHPSLLEKNAKFLEVNGLKDESLHLLAFDVIYCCNGYGLYSGLEHEKKSETIKTFKLAEAQKKLELKRQAKIAEIDEQISELQLQLETYSSISLVNVKVVSDDYGEGSIIEQKGSQISVQFKDCTKSFIIDKKYIKRPTFENNDEIVEAFTEYNRLADEIQKLERQKANI